MQYGWAQAGMLSAIMLALATPAFSADTYIFRYKEGTIDLTGGTPGGTTTPLTITIGPGPLAAAKAFKEWTFDFKGITSVSNPDVDKDTEVTWTLDPAGIPDWLTVNADGSASGTPPEAAVGVTPSFDIVATAIDPLDSLAKEGRRSFTVTVAANRLAGLSVSSGWEHSCAVTSSGSAKCWGTGASGKLGNGPTGTTESPTEVAGFTSGVSAISAGGMTTCAIKDGGAWCWGEGSSGELGNGVSADSPVPVQVQGLGSGVSSISVSRRSFVCAVHNGAGKCWGSGANGELGRAGTTDSNVPVDVDVLTSGVDEVTTGEYHACARASGAAWCWGWNGNGRVANGSAVGTVVTSPSPVTNLGSGVTQISAGHDYTCAIQGGALLCWGGNGYNKLGTAVTGQKTVPTAVQNMGSNVTQVSAGDDHTCAIRSGAAYCWGYGGDGEFGNGGTANASVPQAVSNLTGVGMITAGTSRTCATDGGMVKCWGWNGGTLGDGTSTQRLLPVHVRDE